METPPAPRSLWVAAIVFSLVTGSLGALAMHMIGLYERALVRTQDRMQRLEHRVDEVQGRVHQHEGILGVMQDQIQLLRPRPEPPSPR